LISFCFLLRVPYSLINGRSRVYPPPPRSATKPVLDVSPLSCAAHFFPRDLGILSPVGPHPFPVVFFVTGWIVFPTSYVPGLLLWLAFLGPFHPCPDFALSVLGLRQRCPAYNGFSPSLLIALDTPVTTVPCFLQFVSPLFFFVSLYELFFCPSRTEEAFLGLLTHHHVEGKIPCALHSAFSLLTRELRFFRVQHGVGNCPPSSVLFPFLRPLISVTFSLVSPCPPALILSFHHFFPPRLGS